MRSACSLFWSWLFSFWQDTTMPVGRWVIRTAESVVFTLCPPGPDERNTSTRRSFGSMVTSTGSASASTSTPAAEVWIRPWDSVTGTRCTRCTPPSYFSRAQVPRRAAAGLDRDGHVLVPAEPGHGGVQDLGLPALPLGVAQVHAQQVAGEQRRLLAALAGLDLEDHVLVVVGVARHQQLLQLLLELRPVRPGLLGERPRTRRPRAASSRAAFSSVTACCQSW